MSEKLIVGIYHSLKDAEEAVNQLEKHGFPIALVSVVAKEFDEENSSSRSLNQAAHQTESLKDWFAARFKWVLERPVFAGYENHFHARKYLLVAHGTQDQIAWAYAIIRETGYLDMDVHDEDETIL